MNLENARKGIRLLYTAAIFELIASIIAGSGLFLGFAGLPGLIGTAVFAFIALVLDIIAFVQNIRGLNFAGKDESYFKYAFWIIIGGIIFAAISAFFSSNGTLSMITQILDSIMDIASSLLICLGVAKIFTAQGNEEMAQQGTTTAKVFAIAFAIAQIIKIIMSFNSSSWGLVLGIILSLAVIVLNIVAYVRYLLYLKKASVEL